MSATVAAVVPIDRGSVQVFYRTFDGTTKERLLGRADEVNLSVAIVERPWSFYATPSRDCGETMTATAISSSGFPGRPHGQSKGMSLHS